MAQAFRRLQATDVRRLRQLEAEIARLKKLVAERDLEIEVMRKSRQKMYGPPRPCKVLGRDDDGCVNVAGLSRVNCCCSQRDFSGRAARSRISILFLLPVTCSTSLDHAAGLSQDSSVGAGRLPLTG